MGSKKIAWIGINSGEAPIYPQDLTYDDFLRDCNRTLENGVEFVIVDCGDKSEAFIGLKNVWQMKIGFCDEV